MSEAKGPKVSVPEELMEELTAPAETDLEVEGEAQADAVEGADADPVPVERELEELKDRYLRLAADFDNYKRRTLKERQDLHNYANESLIKEILTTVDNLERAAEHGRKEDASGDVTSLMEGVELTYRSLMQLLEKSEVRVVDPEAQRFDPQVHEAMRQVPCADHEPGIVVEVYQKGYLLKDRLLRPALVAVSSRPEGSPESEPESEETEAESEPE